MVHGSKLRPRVLGSALFGLLGVSAAVLSVGNVATASPRAAVNESAFVSSGGPIPPSSAGDPTGNFRFICTASHFAYDDPIGKPGQPGAAHLHLFFGNTAANAFSTYASLRAAGDGTCDGGQLNRSAYWVPALLDTSDVPQVPEYITMYYKGNGPSIADIRRIQPMPAGLKMIAGYDATDPSAGQAYHWMCEDGTGVGPNIPNCRPGSHIGAVVDFPSCWDGVNVDSADHRHHLAYLTYAGGGGAHCPPGYPVMLPQVTFGIWYPYRAGTAAWRLSSDMAVPGAHGSTFHADWFGAWDPAIQAEFTLHCINELRNCISGQLGDGRSLVNRLDRGVIPVPSVMAPMPGPITAVAPATATAPADRIGPWSPTAHRHRRQR